MDDFDVVSYMMGAKSGGGGGSATNVTYDNTTSGLTATTVQAAIDELASAVKSLNERYTDNTMWRLDTDANDYKTSGLYAMATGNANIPYPWGILFVLGPISDTVGQEYWHEGAIFHREFRNNAWSAWTQL